MLSSNQQAVDGNTTNDINSCTIIDNYYDKEPQLTIDLGQRKDVSGVVIYMWEGQKDSESTYTEFKNGFVFSLLNRDV